MAPDLESALTLVTPENKGPPRVKALPYAPTPATAAVAHVRPLNDNQRALVALAANLADAPGVNLQTHLATVKAQTKQPPPDTTTDVRTASAYVKKQVGNLFQKLLIARAQLEED